MKVRSLVPLFPSLIATLLTFTAGTVSLSTIVPTPVESAMVVPADGLERPTVKVSVASNTLSPTILTMMTPVKDPAGMVRVPEAVVKSEGATAVPGAVA